MKIVDLVGPSGVGKTTLKHALLQTRANLPFRLIDQRMLPLTVIKSDLAKLVLHRWSKSSIRFFRLAALAASEALTQRFRNSVLHANWEPEWGENFRLASRGMVESAELSALAPKLALLIDSTSQAHFARNYICERSVAIFDEGPLQRGISLAQAVQGKDREGLVHYFETCPAPDCAIVATADPATIRSRLSNRPGSSAGHIRDMSFAIEATSICKEALTARGIATLELNLSQANANNTERVIEFISSSYR